MAQALAHIAQRVKRLVEGYLGARIVDAGDALPAAMEAAARSEPLPDATDVCEPREQPVLFLCGSFDIPEPVAFPCRAFLPALAQHDAIVHDACDRLPLLARSEAWFSQPVAWVGDCVAEITVARGRPATQRLLRRAHAAHLYQNLFGVRRKLFEEVVVDRVRYAGLRWLPLNLRADDRDRPAGVDESRHPARSLRLPSGFSCPGVHS